MVAVFGVGCGIAFILAAVKTQIVHNAIVDSLPPQFQDSYNARFAIHAYALSHITPLPLQAEYIQSLCAGCAGIFCMALCFFAVQQPIIGGIILAIVAACVFSTIKSWKTYKENCNRAMSPKNQDDA